MFAKVLGSLWSVLLVPNWSNAIWVLFGKSILLARHRTCCTVSPLTPRLTFYRKYFLHTFRCLLWHAAIKFSIIIIDGPFYCINPVWSLCTLNHPGLLLRGVANISIVLQNFPQNLAWRAPLGDCFSTYFSYRKKIN